MKKHCVFEHKVAFFCRGLCLESIVIPNFVLHYIVGIVLVVLV